MIRTTLIFAALILQSAPSTRTLAQPPDQPAALASMSPNADPSFEVASIRLAKPGSTSHGIHYTGHRISAENQPISNLICFAYSLHKTQLIGAPAWFDNRYDIEGIPDTEGAPTLRQIRQMFQKLLADRFNLKFHRDQRELSIYALTLAKGGPKLTKNTTAREGEPHGSGEGDSQRSFKFSNYTMADFSLELEFLADKPVVDQTGLTGGYDFSLNWTEDDAPQQDPNAAPGLFTAIQEQLGLKLEAKKSPADVLVIDHIDRPSAN
jgi:uncharacterized protein (TIGR03435 family)